MIAPGIISLGEQFKWRKYIKNKKTVIEIGSGNGLIKKFLSHVLQEDSDN